LTASNISKAHPFPFELGFKALELLQAHVMHAIVADMAAGEYVRQPKGIEIIQAKMLLGGAGIDTINQGFSLLQKHFETFEFLPFQSTLIAMNSAWDWYIRNLAGFITVARTRSGANSLGPAIEKPFIRVGSLPIGEQISVLEAVLDCQLPLTEIQTDALKEMALVRNIGIHDNWQTDEKYVSATKQDMKILGAFRKISVTELEEWRAAMETAISALTKNTAIRYKAIGVYATKI
jgi:hypothetical protein